MSKYVLSINIEGYDNVPVGSIITWKDNDYILKFGWHINYSNQEIYSWYLEPLSNRLNLETNTGYDSLSEGLPSYIRTLYKDMFPEIVAVRHVSGEDRELITVEELLDHMNNLLDLVEDEVDFNESN